MLLWPVQINQGGIGPIEGDPTPGAYMNQVAGRLSTGRRAGNTYVPGKRERGGRHRKNPGASGKERKRRTPGPVSGDGLAFETALCSLGVTGEGPQATYPGLAADEKGNLMPLPCTRNCNSRCLPEELRSRLRLPMTPGSCIKWKKRAQQMEACATISKIWRQVWCQTNKMILRALRKLSLGVSPGNYSEGLTRKIAMLVVKSSVGREQCALCFLGQSWKSWEHVGLSGGHVEAKLGYVMRWRCFCESDPLEGKSATSTPCTDGAAWAEFVC